MFSQLLLRDRACGLMGGRGCTLTVSGRLRPLSPQLLGQLFHGVVVTSGARERTSAVLVPLLDGTGPVDRVLHCRASHHVHLVGDGHGDVVPHASANSREVGNDRDVKLLKQLPRSYTRHLQQLWRLEDTAREDDFPVGGNSVGVVGRARHQHAGGCRTIEHDALGKGAVEDEKVLTVEDGAEVGSFRAGAAACSLCDSGELPCLTQKVAGDVSTDSLYSERIEAPGDPGAPWLRVGGICDAELAVCDNSGGGELGGRVGEPGFLVRGRKVHCLLIVGQHILVQEGLILQGVRPQLVCTSGGVAVSHEVD